MLVVRRPTLCEAVGVFAHTPSASTRHSRVRAAGRDLPSPRSPRPLAAPPALAHALHACDEVSAFGFYIPPSELADGGTLIVSLILFDVDLGVWHRIAECSAHAAEAAHLDRIA